MDLAKSDPLRLALITGSTRPGRQVRQVAEWVLASAAGRDDLAVELVDLADFALPLLDEELPAAHGAYAQPHTHAWAEEIGSHEAFIFVVPEYNHGPSAALKNAIDFLFAEWGNKAAGFVSYGIDAGGARAVEQLRLNLAELAVATVRTSVHLSLFDDFEDGKPAPREIPTKKLEMALDQVSAWGRALREVRVVAIA